MTSITIAELAAELESSPFRQWIDVRSTTEFAAGHLPGAVNVPMDEFEARLADLGPEPIVLICKSGKRARMVAGLLEPCRRDVAVVEGGTDAWARARLPLVSSKKTRWSLERQVRLVAGLLILAGTIFALTTSRLWLGLTGFVGGGLTFAGLTDLCPMGILLAAMPWNRSRSCTPVQGGAQQDCCM